MATSDRMGREWVLLGAVGLAAGLCMGLVLVLFAFNLGRKHPVPTIPPPTATVAPPTPTDTPPPPTKSLCPASEDFFDEAECLAWQYGLAEQAIELLTPRLEELETDADRVRAYRLLADAETYLQHFQLAAVYLEWLYALDPTAETLMQLARAHDLGGDLERAMARYMEMANWEGAEGDPYRQAAIARIDDLTSVLGTPTPSAGTPPYQPSPTLAPTPYYLAYSTPRPMQGTGPFVIPAGDRVLLTLLPEAQLEAPVEFVLSLVLHFQVGGGEQDEPALLDFSIYSPGSGGWAINQGNNDIPHGITAIEYEYPDPYVGRDGIVVLDIRNYGEEDIQMEDLALTLVVRGSDGIERTYGLTGE
jgi:hypothetical protein